MAAIDVLVAEDVWGEPFEALAAEFDVVRTPELAHDRTRLLDTISGARALVVRNRTLVDAELLGRGSRLEVVARAGVGLDNIDVAAADARGIAVIAPRGANAVSVAEHTLALALALARSLTTHDRSVRSGQWHRRPGIELSGKTWTVLGAGATGLAVVRLARALGMRTLGYDPYIAQDDPQAIAAGIQLMPLGQAVEAADVLSIHLPATVGTRNLVGAPLLDMMRPGSLIINVGRGEVVDEAALLAALRRGRPAAAALDVRAVEPPQPGELEQLDNVLLTPHIAGITVESQQRITRVLAEDIRTVLQGGEARAAVGAVTRTQPLGSL